MTWDIYIWILFSFTIINVGLPFAAWITNYYNLKVRNKWVHNYFNSSLNLNKFPLFLKSEKWKLFIVYYFSVFLTSITYIGSCFLISNNDSFFISHILLMSMLYLISLGLITLFFIKFNNKLKLIKFSLKNETPQYFINHFIKTEKTFEYQSFSLINKNNNKISVYNTPFQINQKRIQKKLTKSALNNVSYSEFKFFLNYLRANANFIHRVYNQKEIIIIINDKEISLEQFQFILIDNFKYMIQNTKN